MVRPTSENSDLLKFLPSNAILVHDLNVLSLSAKLSELRPTVVFHLSSLFLSSHQAEDIKPLIEANLLFGTQLVDAMGRVGIRRMVNTGTSWQHYESRDYSPVNLYAATKQAFEEILQYYVEAHGMQIITLKLFDTYGPDDHRQKLFSLLKRAAEGEPLDMSPGAQCIDLVHVGDVAEAFRIAAERLLDGQVSGHERYAVSSGNPMSLRDVVGLVESALKRKLPIEWGGRPYRSREVMQPWVGSALPGWKPAVDLAAGLAEIGGFQP